MQYVYIGIGVVVVGVAIYFFLNRKPATPHEVEEAVSTDIFKKIPLKDVQENKSIIIGIDQSFVLFENMRIVYTHDGYRVNYKDVLPYTKLDRTKHDPNDNLTINQFNAFKIQTGIIRDIEIDNKQPVQFFDNFYNVLIKLTMDIRLSCKIVNKTKFLSNVGGFRDIMTKKEFAGLISKSVGSKIYAYLSSFVVDKGVSYLHMSLYKHDIEEYMIDEFNIDLDSLGIELTSIELKNFEFEDEEEFKAFEANLLEKSRMNILDYSYEDKMNKEIKYHEDIDKIYDVKDESLKVKM